MVISGMMLNKCETAEAKTFLPFPLPGFFFPWQNFCREQKHL
jgi:hypothetical protein